MPNYVTNIIHFQGDAGRIASMRTAVQDDQYGMSGIDFNKIIPMPSGLWMGGITPDTRAKYGKNNWLDWSIANWGTKWNAFRFDDDDHFSDSTITFVTANNAPAPIAQRFLFTFRSKCMATSPSFCSKTRNRKTDNQHNSNDESKNLFRALSLLLVLLFPLITFCSNYDQHAVTVMALHRMIGYGTTSQS